MSRIENEINQLAETIINLFHNQNVSFKRDDQFSYMTAVFYYKQRYHLESLLKLNEGHDLELICRCMIEGMAILNHAQNDSNFISRWMAQGDIEDLKILEEKQKSDFFVENRQKNIIKQRVNNLPQNLLKDKAQKDIKQKKRAPKYADYKSYKIPMKKLVEGLSKQDGFWNDIYYVYDIFSKWQHWNPRGVSQFVKNHNDELSFIEDYDLRLTTLTYGVFCLIQTSKIFNETFKLNQEDRLSALEKQMVLIYNRLHQDH